MPDNIPAVNPYRPDDPIQRAGWVATWTESDVETTSSASAVHAAEVGKSHFLLGFVCTEDSGETGPPNHITATVKDGGDTILTFEFYGLSAEEVGGYYPYTSTLPFKIILPAPIQISENSLVSVTLAMASPTTEHNSVNMWGFTDDARVS